MRQPIPLIGLLAIAAFLVIGCHKADPGAADAPSGKKAQDAQVLNLFWWSDFIAPDTIPNFEKQTGIKVHISYYDSEETLETRVLRGKAALTWSIRRLRTSSSVKS